MRLSFLAPAEHVWVRYSVFMKILLGVLVLLVGVLPIFGTAQELIEDTVSLMKARVVSIEREETALIPGTDTPAQYQTILVEVLDGQEKGKEILVENDYLSLDEGDVFYLGHTVNQLDNVDYYTVKEAYRVPQLLLLLGLFIAITVFLGGVQGIRGLLSLSLSFFVIIFALLPGILAGYSPVLIAVGTSSFIVLVGAYVTHGVSRMTTTAVLGMVATIVFTGLLAFLSIHWTKLSGFSADEATYLHFNSRGTIDLAGLLLGGIIIGLLGVLYDAAIGQSVAVEELQRAGKAMTRKDIYFRALRIGREHIGALINTLAIAYVGAALPLLLLFYGTQGLDVVEMVNREIFAAEIVRILVGSIGVILVVPITTAIAVLMLVKDRDGVSDIVTEMTAIPEQKISSKHAHRH